MSDLTTTVALTAPVVVPLVVAGGYALTSLRAPRAAMPQEDQAHVRPREPATVGAGAAGSGGTPQDEAPAPKPTEAAAGRRWTDWCGLLGPLTILACATVLAATRDADGAGRTALGGLLRADALAVWMLLVIGAVALIACATAPAYLAGERSARDRHAGQGPEPRAAIRFHSLVQAFLAAMCLAVLTANLGVLWVAIEATTVATAFLVGHRRTRTSVEAAWKYVVLCSAGIALAFLGTVIIYYAARQAGIPESHALDLPTLLNHAGRLDPEVTRLGIALVVLGFGAKAGLVPLHAWLPDAHSQAPAPVSALMSGVLLPVAFTAILRYQSVADAALGSGYTRTLLTGIALLSLALAAALLLAQSDYKRMLAYSTMEHMSLIALGAAIGTPLARTALLLHIAGHGLAKSVAFCASGHILDLTGTSRIGRVRGLLTRAPALGGAFGLAVIALLGFPPFTLFASELGIVRAGFAAGKGWVMALALLLVLIAFAALALRTARMLLGTPKPGPRGPAAAEGPRTAALWPLALGLTACAVLGMSTGPLTDLLQDAAQAIGAH